MTKKNFSKTMLAVAAGILAATTNGQAQTAVQTPLPKATQFYDFDGSGKKGFVFGKTIGDWDNEQVQINLHGNFTQDFALQNTLGAFSYKSGIWQGNDNFWLVLEDVNRDGQIDIGLIHSVPNVNADTLLLSQSDSSYNIVTGGLVANADLNMDGRIDLLENPDGQNEVSSGIVKYIHTQTASGAFVRSFLQAMTYDEYTASLNQADYEAYLAAVQANRRPPRPNFSGLSIPDESAPDLTNTKPTQVMDMNSDDIPDLIVEGSGLVFYGTEKPNRYITGAVGNNVKSRDLNADGFTDFVVWDESAQQLKTLVYRGEGNYQTTVLMQDIPADKNIYCYDLDKDGDIDILATFSYPYNKVGSFTLVGLNDGNGNFTINEDGSAYVHLVYLGCADINSDGYYDLLAVETDNEYYNTGCGESNGYGDNPGDALPVKVQYGQANGVFAAAQNLYTANADYTLNAMPQQVAFAGISLNVADIDSDGKAEIWLEGDRQLFHVENGAANTAPAAPTAPAVQFDGATGRLEITWTATSDAQSSACDLTYALRIGTAPGLSDVVFAHANTDGNRRNFACGNAGNNLRKVFDVSSWQPRNYYISVQAIDPQHSGSTFSAETVFENTFFKSLFTTDKTSLAFCDSLTLFYNPLPAGYTPHWMLDGAVQLPSSATGELHLQWTAGGMKTISLQVETPGGAMSQTTEMQIEVLSNKIASEEADEATETVKRNGVYKAWFADWDMNGSQDALFQPFITNNNTEYAGLYKNGGAGNFTKLSKLFNLTFAPTHAKWLDWDIDGDVDMFFGIRDRYGEFTFGTLINNGNDNFTKSDISLQANSGLHGETVFNMADLDNDGKLDAISPNWSNEAQANVIYKNNGNGIFSEKIISGNGYEITYHIADFNNDGYLDYFYLVYARNGNNYTYTGVKLLENKGGFTFETKDIPFEIPVSVNRGFDIGVNGQPVFADFDNDGYIDIAYCANEKRLQILHNERNGQFVQGDAVVIAGNISILANSYGQIYNPASIGDLDNNGYLDLLLYVKDEQRKSAYYILYNDGNGVFRQGLLSDLRFSINQYGEYSTAMGEVITDINGDGVSDIYLGSEFLRQEHDENDYWNTTDYYNVFDNHLTAAANTPPQAPAGLIAVQTAAGLVIEWDAAADSETPAMQMRYNISVKKAGQSGANAYIISPLNSGNTAMAALPSRKGGVPLPPSNYDQEGISKHYFYPAATRFEIPASVLPEGDVEISVQAIDLRDAMSPFSAVLTKTIEASPSFQMPATACFDSPVEIAYIGTQGGEGSLQWDFDGGAIVSGSGFGPYQVQWNSEGVKTISLTANGVTRTSQIKVLPDFPATFMLAGNVFFNTEMEIGLPAVPDGSTFSWSLSNNTSIFLEHNISARAGNTKGTLKITGGCECYRELTLTVTTPNGCSKSFTKGFNVIPAIKPPQITLVYPNENNKNVIAWEQGNLPANSVSVIVYKEGSALNDFYEIGRVSAATGEFTDLSSNNVSHSDRYAISALLPPDVESPKSETHQTLHLTINRGATDNTWNLLWNAYQGREIASYRILQGAAPGNLTLLQELSGINRSFTHADNPSMPYYAVEYIPSNANYAPADRSIMRAAKNAPAAGRSNMVYSGNAGAITYITQITVQTLAANPVLSETQPYIYLYTEIFPSNATCRNVVWEIIAGSEFAVIDGNGKLQASRNAQAGEATVKATAADGSGISVTRTFSVQAFTQKPPAVGVTSVTPDNIIRVFPNPAKEEIFIQSELPVKKVEIYSLTGALLLSESNFNGKISVPALSSGVYILKIHTGSGTVIKKIMKE
jgi:hypothetical protein